MLGTNICVIDPFKTKDITNYIHFVLSFLYLINFLKISILFLPSILII